MAGRHITLIDWEENRDVDPEELSDDLRIYSKGQIHSTDWTIERNFQWQCYQLILGVEPVSPIVRGSLDVCLAFLKGFEKGLMGYWQNIPMNSHNIAIEPEVYRPGDKTYLRHEHNFNV